MKYLTRFMVKLGRLALVVGVVVLSTSCDPIIDLIRKQVALNEHLAERQLEEEEEEQPDFAETRYKDGKLKSYVKLDEDGRAHGEMLKYFPSGKCQSKILFEHGQKLSAKQYYESGTLEMDFPYEGGMMEGKRKKYWKNGKLSSELTYHQNQPGSDLVEYSSKGEKLSNYPGFTFDVIDQRKESGKLLVDFYFDYKPGRGMYYLGKLEDGFLPKNNKLELTKVNGKGRWELDVPPNQRGSTDVDVIGVYKTNLGNLYIVHKTFKVSI